MNQLNMFKQILIHYASSKVENFQIKTSLFLTLNTSAFLHCTWLFLLNLGYSYGRHSYPPAAHSHDVMQSEED